MEVKLKIAEGDESQVRVERMEMDDPNFESGTPHNARATFKNPKTAPFAYSGVIYLGKSLGDKVVSSPVKAFTVPAGGTLPVDFAVTMPTLSIVQDSYHVYLEVSQAGAVLITFVSTEDVVVFVTPAIDITTITWTT